MSGYARKEDVLPCSREDANPSRRHEWFDYQKTSDDPPSFECSYCAALLIIRWWGLEFLTGEEHFAAAGFSIQELIPRDEVL